MKKTLFGVLVTVLLSLGAVYIVQAATADTKPPTLKSISIKNPKASYSVGDKVYLNIKANDDISGINRISLALYYEYIYDENGALSSKDGISADIYDLESNPYFIIPFDVATGDVNIETVDLVDNAGNSSSYNSDKEFVDFYKNNTEWNGEGLYYFDLNMKFKVNSNRDNAKGPILNNISFGKTNLKYGDSLHIDVSASANDDDIIGAMMEFNLEGTDKYFWKSVYYDSYNKIFSGDFLVPSYNGTYKLTSVQLWDSKQASTYYRLKDSEYFHDYDLNYNLKFTVSGAPDADENIQIAKLDYEYKKIVAPNLYKIGIKLNKNTDLVDSITVIASLKGNEYKTVTTSLYKDSDGYYIGYFDIDQFIENGIYTLKEIILNDGASSGMYSSVTTSINNNLKYDKVDLFEVIDEDKYDIITSTTDKDLISKIKGAKDDAKIAISSTNSSIVKKDVFRAIKGTNKTIYIESNGIQWVFNGQDITKPKNIDVTTTINYIYNDELNSTLADYLGNSIVINFANNGKLPGIALIRVKTDYALRDYLGIEDLNVYYYNENRNSKMFNNVANGISMTEDGYLEFYINHNSTFIISNKKIDDEYVSDEIDDLALNDEKAQVEKKQKENIKESKNMLLYAGIGAGVIAGIIGVTIIIVHKKKKKLK